MGEGRGCRRCCCCCWCCHSRHSRYCYGCCCHSTAAAAVAGAAAPAAVIAAPAPAIVAHVIPRPSILALTHSFACAHCHLYRPSCEPWPTRLHSLVQIPPPSVCTHTHRSLHSFVLDSFTRSVVFCWVCSLARPCPLWYFTYNRIVSIL